MKTNEHTINLPLLYCGNLSAAKEQCFLWDEGGKTHLSSPHPQLGYSPRWFGQQHTLHLLKQHRCARTDYVLGDRQPGEAAIKDELNIIVELLMASHGVVLTFAREMATRVQRALDAGCTAPIAGFQPGETAHPARESNDRDRWCITDVFADVSVRSLSPVLVTGTPQLVRKRLLVVVSFSLALSNLQYIITTVC